MKKIFIIFSLVFALICASSCKDKEQQNINLPEYEEYVLEEYDVIKAFLPEGTYITFKGVDTVMTMTAVDSLETVPELSKFISVFSAGDSIYCAIKDMITGEITIKLSECLSDKLVEDLDFSYLFDEAPSFQMPDTLVVAEEVIEDEEF